MLSLRFQTPDDWAPKALSNFDAFLIDHASCERKASAVGLSFVVRYPDRPALIEPMIQFAREELEHYHQVCKIILERGLTLAPDEEDPYVNRVMREVRTGRDERLLDRLLVSSLIEARGAERIALVADHLEDPKLKTFYARLARAEEHHRDFFLEIARLFFSEEVIAPRLDYLLDVEAASIRAVPYRSTLH